jgi:Ran GTPase-activating protein (RanGAP) involved in mRNA processing and transport
LIEKNTIITDLNIRESQITDDGIEILFKSLKKNNTLKRLNLSSFHTSFHLSLGNKVGTKSSKSISNFFKNKDSLEEINLDSAFLSEAQNILESFTTSKNLKSLYLKSFN